MWTCLFVSCTVRGHQRKHLEWWKFDLFRKKSIDIRTQVAFLVYRKVVCETLTAILHFVNNFSGNNLTNVMTSMVLCRFLHTDCSGKRRGLLRLRINIYNQQKIITYTIWGCSYENRGWHKCGRVRTNFNHFVGDINVILHLLHALQLCHCTLASEQI